MNALGTLTRIERSVREATGNAFRITDSRAISGGDTHRALSVSDGRVRYFVKHGGAETLDMFEAEANGLAALADTDALRVPAVIGLGADDNGACLILEHLELRPLQNADDGTRFAEALAEMHHFTGEHFGWERDNFIGRNPQANAPTASWARFFAEQRLRPQLAWARENGFTGELQRHGERLIARLPAMFLDYRPQPALLHGDLWHGNVGMTESGQPAAFDPAVHYGDRESDIAMSELFGGFPPAFYAAYRKIFPLNDGFEARKPLYALYHMLNHLNLFGRSYLGESERLITRLDHALGTRSE